MSLFGLFCALAFFATYRYAAVEKEESCNVMAHASIHQTSDKRNLSCTSLPTEEVTKDVARVRLYLHMFKD